MPIGRKKVIEIIKTKELYVTNDVPSDEGIQNREFAHQYGCRSYIGYPIMINEEVIGVFSMFSSQPFDQLTIDSLKSTADTVAIGIRRKQIERELKDKNRMLEEINEDLLQAVQRETRLREEKESMLLQQSKMASMGEMLGLIAHQWRQPLNAIALLTQGLEDLRVDTVEEETFLKETIQNMMMQVDFMSKTINDFREFLKPNKDIVSFMPCRSVRDVVNMIQGQLKINNIMVTIECDEGILLQGIPNEFMHVILNIMNNSRDAIVERRQKGSLAKTEEGIIGIRVYRDNEKDKAVIEISDNGGGIPIEVLDRVFDPYYTTKSGKDGTGLGLYMVKTIVEKNFNGSISIQNIDNGLKVTIYL
ncbi:MAG: GAF domain-containing sensor histidine kinase [Thermodesulfovibrionales bacterium]